MLAEDLTDEDIDNIKMFNIRLKGHISRRLHEYVRHAFADRLKFDSPYKLYTHIAQLAGISEETYDCCVNSCCAFTGALSETRVCPYCKEERYDMHGHHRQIFRYLPFTPRLTALFSNRKSSELMQYRAVYKSGDGELSDVFDGSHYCHLQSRQVWVDGIRYDHCFFSDEHDVALGIMTDGFQIFKRQRGGTQTCWLILAINFNLPPTIRTHLTNIIPLAIIPGPKAPTDFNSYFRPFINEAKRLASTGVPAIDAINHRTFTLRAYPISCHGDMVAIKHCMCFKGHNGLRPCCACEIKAVRDTSKPHTPYYVPLRQPHQPNQDTNEWLAHKLPLRSDKRIDQQLDTIQAEPTKVAKRRAQTRWGINGRCDLVEIPSLSLTNSFPHEWMHLFLENHGKNLVALWTGRYKDMDEGKELYVIPSSVWEDIGKETAAAGSTIPSCFGRRTPNIATELHLFTAEDWGFWFVEIAPHVLKYRFPKDKFYNHFLKFNYILRQTLKFSLTEDDIEDLRVRIISYVQEYEKYVISCPLCPTRTNFAPQIVLPV